MNPNPVTSESTEPVSFRLTLRKREAAEMLGISERTLHDLLATGVIPSFKLKRVVLIPLDGIKAFIERRTQAEGQP